MSNYQFSCEKVYEVIGDTLIPQLMSNHSAQRKCLELSREKKGQYVTFEHGICDMRIEVSDALNVHSPSDAILDAYWINGEEKSFTEEQIQRDDHEWNLYLSSRKASQVEVQS